MAFSLTNLKDLANVAIKYNASDIHLRTDEPPVLRIGSELVPVQSKSLSEITIYEICAIIFTGHKYQGQVDKITEADGAFNIPDLCRVRFNFFKYTGRPGLVLRIISKEIPTIESLNLNPIIKNISNLSRGLVLVTGPTGCGKSSTLAAIINEINKKKAAHIITIEDPIEFVHPQIKSRLSQREVTIDTPTFAEGLRSALRQDPDVILIGEMRDAETISTALSAAETGHLVLSTIHTKNTIATITRIISMFSGEQQADIKKALAENLQATIGQRLLKSEKGAGKMVAALEIMMMSPGIRECILGEQELRSITAIIERGSSNGGGQSFDQSILDLFKRKIISREVAAEEFSSPADFSQKLLIE
ncbi:MAG: hypothetical protein A2504_05685 [Bdellovibrionales bacterium RIFOXYD12_FULL_39_22]|nr:MAG: hypothetical protein A2385_06140 [Bdellovibrionales bacterium RIFOXYB1_FULL_39_21]OFZ41859.1 MAG: hypothetical protein A2485_08110 [Bdellovibrionales bacterium RIFOXYC12_FULL_39_17]OFZ50575.1 MAG: hypothetical protein A2404_05060 [Bdellovibrionales bacterium RIFOXYC1_FULL_39_130]OFZ69150.1 MAG: hypothetical protein A2451_00955 [Bdellovibrionales bacterium RIFOXYC2_FULL_39_8]OFZ77798.1 MAG: hypothetical protein A2560_00230 [Bdellovibrionales bacterium RIFOXYD1_FULL_39_84]OFZ93766.1 MAG: